MSVMQNVPVDPITQLSSAFDSITAALAAHKTHKGSLESAKEAQARAAESLVVAQTRTTEVQSTVTTQVDAVVVAIDAASAALLEVKNLYVG